MSSKQTASRGVITWLWLTCALLLAMIIVGGVTRLTGSGLSIVRWEPIIGALPPQDSAQWQRVFALYQESPQYQLVNHGMDLEAFKSIFWWEYFHRLLGRGIGLVVGLPLIAFWLTGRLSRRRTLALAGIFALGGLQGVVGWLMVRSGLVDLPQVSHYRLTLHLGIGFLIFGLVFWQALSVSFGEGRARRVAHMDPQLRLHVVGFLLLVCVTVLCGGLVAGLKAGQAFPTFPLMAGYWVPPGLFACEPLWRNFVDSAVTVHFQHRVLALLVTFATGYLALRAFRAPPQLGLRRAASLLTLAVALQVVLGVVTVLLSVPVWAGAAHQVNAALLLAATLNLMHVLSASVPEPVPEPRRRPSALAPALVSRAALRE
ncbi:MAG TPA: COX15/CtaA family protein [Polyangiaceae bacterium]|nr:COX15/CtaA family protein [Polyangiaceae bacterium]